MKKNISNFCSQYGLTEKQFYGTEKYNGSLYLRGLTAIPEGFNPTVGGSLYLSSLTAIPEGFNPTVGGSLDLRSLTAIPEGFNPTVGGSLDLSSLTAIPEGFNPTVGGSLDLRSLTAIPEGFNESKFEQKEVGVLEWKGKEKNWILADGCFSEVISKRGNVYTLRDIGKQELTYLVTDGVYYSHGKTIQEAKADLVYKKSNKDTSAFVGLDLDEKRSFDFGIEAYRSITGACGAGVRRFVEEKGLFGRSFSIREIADVTRGAYNSKVFCDFFNL